MLSEFEYRFPDNSWLLDDVIILPDLIEDAEHFRQRGFDEADIFLLLYARNKGNWIITEDYGMLTEAMIQRDRTIMLIDFLYKLYQQQFIYENELIDLVNLFKKWRNITNKKQNQLLQSIE